MKHIKTYDSINEAKFNFTEAEIKNAAETLAKAMAKSDKVKVEVHDFEYDKGRGAGFELSYDGDKYDGGSYYIKPNGDVINAAIKGGTKYGNVKSSEKDYLKYFKANESVNEAKKLGLGDKGVDYNDNVVEIIAMGNYNKIAKMLKKETGNDPEDYGYEKAPGNFYLTKNIKATEGNVGDIAMYPVKYDMGNYWGLDPLKESINEEYIESMDSIEIANALGKIKTLWDTWKGGPMTEPSDVKPAQRELKGWMDRWFKQNIK